MVAFYLPGGFPIYAYSLLIGLGVTLGLGWAVWQAAPHRQAQLLQAGLWVCLGALIGGRVGYVGFNFSYYRVHPWESLQVFMGGLSWPGALAGALLAFGLYTWLARQSAGETADGLLPLAASLCVTAWLGAWLEAGERHGLQAFVAPVERPSDYLTGALLSLFWFWFLQVLQRGRLAKFFPPGAAAALGLLGFIVILYQLLPMQTGPAQLWQGRQLEEWLLGGFAGLALLALAAAWFWRPARPGSKR